MKLGDLVHVTWEDSLGCVAGWQFFEERSTEPGTIESVGWILTETKRAISLVPHVARSEGVEDHGMGILTIPKSCILKRTTISLSSSPALSRKPRRI